MSILTQLNSPAMYLICGGIVFIVALMCLFFMVRAYKAGKAIGMDTAKMKRPETPTVACMEKRRSGHSQVLLLSACLDNVYSYGLLGRC